MPVNYYLDGTNLGNSTSVYNDADLTQLADDGFYSDGYTYRQLSGGVLLPAVTCPSCDGGGTVCVEYTVSNPSGIDSVEVRYKDCDNVNQIFTVQPDSESQPFCAIMDSVTLTGNGVITQLGDCPTP